MAPRARFEKGKVFRQTISSTHFPSRDNCPEGCRRHYPEASRRRAPLDRPFRVLGDRSRRRGLRRIRHWSAGTFSDKNQKLFHFVFGYTIEMELSYFINYFVLRLCWKKTKTNTMEMEKSTQRISTGKRLVYIGKDSSTSDCLVIQWLEVVEL